MPSSAPTAPALPALAPLPPLVIGTEGKRQLARRLRQHGIGAQSKAQAQAQAQGEQAAKDTEAQATTESLLQAVKVTVETAKEKETQRRAALAPAPTEGTRIAELPGRPGAAPQLGGQPEASAITGQFRVSDIESPQDIRQRVAEAGERARQARQALIPTRIEQAGGTAEQANVDLASPPPSSPPAPTPTRPPPPEEARQSNIHRPPSPTTGLKPGHLMGPAYNAPATPQPEPYRGIGASGPLPRPQPAPRSPRKPPSEPTAPVTPPEPAMSSGGLLERMHEAGRRFRDQIARHAPLIIRQRITWQEYERMFGERPAKELSDEEIDTRLDWIQEQLDQKNRDDRFYRRKFELLRERRKRESEHNKEQGVT